MKVLLAIDESEPSEAATRAVLARGPGTEVRILHVVEPAGILIPSLLSGAEMGMWKPAELDALREARLRKADALVRRAADTLKKGGLEVVAAVEEGDPRALILDIAADWHPDVIVVGSHGRTGLDRFLLGSVSEAVARHAPCSVEIARVHE
ncbi:MAG TPA: universal stress protein [Gemmatimonadales bacterium]|nr:universal stress protein [Gemmatimonadales bacterium]